MKQSLRGYSLAGGSVLLTTTAQLTMKWGMIHLPTLSLSWFTSLTLFAHVGALLLVCIGVTAYLLSMICWLQALHYLPLNRAYPLLSISYALVYLATAILPWYHESFTIIKTLGVTLITLGVWLIVSHPSDKIRE